VWFELYNYCVCVCVCERVRAERSKISLRMNLVYDYCRRGEKVKKESDGKVREGGVWKENWDNSVWVLTRDYGPDFREIEIVRPNKIRVREKGSNALWELLD